MAIQNPSPDDESNGQSNWMRSLGYFSIIVGDIAGYTGVGIGIGYLAWKKWHAPWWVLLLTSMAGLTLSFYRIYRVVERDIENGK